nr:ribonuclease H-like domain-containing protein [Tanacetum cinerariifolium]
FKQIEKLDLEEMDFKWQMAMLFVRVHKFEQKAGRKINFDKKESARFNKKKDIRKKEEDSKALITVDTLLDWTDHDGESDGVIASKEFSMIAGCDTEDAIKESAVKIYNLITEADKGEASTTSDAGEFALMGVTSETKLDNHLVQTEKWRNSFKNLFRLIDSSMSIRTKVGLGFTDCISENELGWDDSAFSVFTTNSEDVEGHTDLDESQMFYGTKSSTSCDPKYVPNDFVSCDDSGKSLEVNTNNFASSDSSFKSSNPKPNDSTPCASTSSVSTYEYEAEIESNVGTPIQEPIIIQDLSSFSCNRSDKNENTSRTYCNKNGYFNKKAGHFRKHASSVSKLCFVCGSGTHLIKDCDFYEKQMANKTVVPIGKQKVSTPVPPGRQNRPFLVPTDRGYSPSENPFSDAKVEGIFDSGCSRSMTGNKERLVDFQVIQGG